MATLSHNCSLLGFEALKGLSTQTYLVFIAIKLMEHLDPTLVTASHIRAPSAEVVIKMGVTHSCDAISKALHLAATYRKKNNLLAALVMLWWSTSFSHYSYTVHGSLLKRTTSSPYHATLLGLAVIEINTEMRK